MTKQTTIVVIGSLRVNWNYEYGKELKYPNILDIYGSHDSPSAQLDEMEYQVNILLISP